MKTHPLFERFPLTREVRLSTGPAPAPYHVYDGQGAFIGGFADGRVARELLSREAVQPVLTADGRALMGLWVFDFQDASLGAHHELQFSLFVAREPVAPVAAHPLALLELMLERPDVQMLCHGLWNSTPVAVAYNRELLALDARLSASRIRHDARALSFDVTDEVSATPLLSGRIAAPGRASLRANLALLGRIGMGRLLGLAREPWIRMPVMNPVGPVLARNASADSYTHSRSALRYFDPKRDSLKLAAPRYRELGFAPQFVQTMSRFRFVYLFPDAAPQAALRGSSAVAQSDFTMMERSSCTTTTCPGGAPGN